MVCDYFDESSYNHDTTHSMERVKKIRFPYLCFTVIFTICLQKDASGEKLKDLAIEMNITPSAVTYLKQKVPRNCKPVGHSF